jgi:peptidoglycan/xylan/chitin deacetylase (PgdA/CDA1 family)
MIVVTYHNVIAHTPGAFNMLARKEWLSLRAFEKQIDELAGRYRIVPLADVADAVRAGRTLPDACALTFDDGNLGAYRYAAPLLEARGLPATFFVVTGRLEGTVPHDAFDRLEALLALTGQQALDLASIGEATLSSDCDGCRLRCYERLSKRLRMAGPRERDEVFDTLSRAAAVGDAGIDAYLSHEAYQSMTWDDARDLVRRGFAVGSHGHTHVALSKVDDAQLAAEVDGSYRALTSALGGAASEVAFSYPFGKSKHISELATANVRAAGFTCAVTMGPGSNTAVDLFLMRRMVYKEARKPDRA